MTSNLNFEARPLLQVFVIALCVVSKSLNMKTARKFCFVVLFNLFIFVLFIYLFIYLFLLMTGKQCKLAQKSFASLVKTCSKSNTITENIYS